VPRIKEKFTTGIKVTGVFCELWKRANMRKRLLTDEVVSQIPHWMREEGLGLTEIAARIGCTVGTLRAVCSRSRISLKRPSKPHTRRNRGLSFSHGTPPGSAELRLKLPSQVRGCLKARAALFGMSELELAAGLLKIIARDDLYRAILGDNRQHRSPQ
jgi:hypothetical protein